jgi:hypothetical protein
MRKQILALFISLLSIQAFALEVDYQARLVSRTYPIALAVQGDFGVGQKLWEANKVMYGYARLAGVYSASGVVNLAGVRGEIYPISFLGFFAQADKSQRDVDLSIFDCDVIDCEGTVSRNRVGAKLGLAFGRFFLMSEYQIIDVEHDDSDKTLFADLQHSLEALSAGDEVKRLQLVAGFKLTKSWSMVGIYISQEMQKNYNRDFMKLGGLQYESGNWAYLGTGGVFKNRQGANVATVLFAVIWKGKKGVKLF